MVLVERFLKTKRLLSKHCELSLMENLAFGERLTIVVLVMESIQPKEEETLSCTLKVPVRV